MLTAKVSRRDGIPIAGLHSVTDIVEVVKRAARTTAEGEWIVLMPMGEPPSVSVDCQLAGVKARKRDA
jgi:hypothetical protein